VHFTPPSGLADVLDTACAQAGFEPRAAVRTEQAPSALNLARAGLGITLVPGNVVPAQFDGVLTRVEPPIRRALSVYTRVRPDPVTAAFVDAISDEALTNPPHVQSLLSAARG
jgi:DNA-binding transcriptional LysR family regulator